MAPRMGSSVPNGFAEWPPNEVSRIARRMRSARASAGIAVFRIIHGLNEYVANRRHASRIASTERQLRAQGCNDSKHVGNRFIQHAVKRISPRGKPRLQPRDSRLNRALPGCRASARLQKRTFSSFPTLMTRTIEGPDTMQRNADCPNHAAVERALVAARSSIDCASVARYSIARSSMARSSTAMAMVVDPRTCFRRARLRPNSFPIPLPRHSVAAMSYARSRP